MPCLYITTNLNLDGIDKDPIFSDATSAVSSIIGKPPKVCLYLSPLSLFGYYCILLNCLLLSYLFTCYSFILYYAFGVSGICYTFSLLGFGLLLLSQLRIFFPKVKLIWMDAMKLLE